MSEEKNINVGVEFKEPNLTEGLVLYFHPKNFHSQKILFILYEKNIKFTPYVLDLAHGEQYSSWFLSKNPKGDVPVLEDNGLVVPSSQSIINYLEGKFKGANYPPLIPTDKKSIEYTKSVSYEEILSKLPVGALSLGSFIHKDLKLNPKPPFTGAIRQSCIENNDKVYEMLKKSVNESSDYQKSTLKDKLNLQQRRKELIYCRVEFQRVLDKFEIVLKQFEKELEEGPEKDWLLSSEFYSVDVSFGLLLERLDTLGFEDYYWANGKLPKIKQYYSRFRERPVFKKVMPTNNVGVLTNMWMNTPAQYKLGAGVIGMAMFAAFAHK
ncbi:ganglioside-induced differentiation-associated protein 1 [Episyrphus balteatus]|uniref:ganglioside-induced differentiation-associated protein 1 n=1 Tax=Episyrphus balteatus TaxID=286459 RepID=UPI0024857570|nr:ganglioside-induced differentiation-associated protein 1 [Episyrphus balteatus]